MAIVNKTEARVTGREMAGAHQVAAGIIDNVGKVIIGKTEAIKLAGDTTLVSI